MKSLIKALQLPEIVPDISDLLSEQVTSETKINPQPSDIQPVTFTKSVVINPLDSVELNSAQLSNLDDDAPRGNIATVTDLSTIALLPNSNAGFTENTYVDGILWGGNHWNTGASNQIDYSFWNSGTESFDDSRGVNFATNPYNWTAGEKAAMVQALDTWAAVADITFVDVGDNNANATFGFYNVDNSQLDSSLGRFQPPGTNGQGIGYFNWQGTGWDYINGNQQGDYGFVTMIHELGHGLGLAHPHDNGGGSYIYPGVKGIDSDGDGYPNYYTTGDFRLNQGIYTTMSYNDGLTASGGNPGTNDYGYQGTPMAFDIAAIQHLYGANMSYNTGNDVYFLPTVNASGTFYSCIWDAGGIDKISGFGASAGVNINLNDATLNITDGEGAGGYRSAAMGIFGGFTIANGVTIENADGSDFDDSIVGNEFNNSLFGDDGNDNLIGGWGHDSLYGDGGNDSLYGGGDNDYHDGGEGDDLIAGWNGNDTLIGGGGGDTMYGGGGDDLYYVDAYGEFIRDNVYEYFNEGIDTVMSSAYSYSLNANVENVTLIGNYSESAYGNDLDNIITGNDNDNYLWGREGNDSLSGGGSDDVLGGYGGYVDGFGTEYDTLAGGSGADVFVLGSSSGAYYWDNAQSNYSAGGYATITDFNYAEGDKFQVHGSASDYSLREDTFNGGIDILYQGDLIGYVSNTTDVIIAYDFDFV